MEFEIIDFHMHPFTEKTDNVCQHKDYFNMTTDEIEKTMRGVGISKICGSVIEKVENGPKNTWDIVKRCNEKALKLREYFNGFYIPGFQVHPDFIEESINEILYMKSLGVNLMGEIVPHENGWDDYSRPEFSEILAVAGENDMIVNLHTKDADIMDKVVENHKDITFVLAHPGEFSVLMRHISRMQKNENCYLDISGTGIFRYGVTRRLIDSVGVDRILFGTDYPSCNPGMFVGGILFDTLLTDNEKEKIFAENAKKLLKLQ